MPASYIGGKVMKLIVRDVFRNIRDILTLTKFHSNIEEILDKKGNSMSADNLPDKSRNLSSYIMKCESSEKFKLLLEKCQLILRRTFFQNICCNIFMK